MRQAADALKPGQVSAPVRTPSGFHVVKLIDVRAAAPRPLADVKEQLRTMLRAQRTQQNARTYLANLAANAPINEDALKKALAAAGRPPWQLSVRRRRSRLPMRARRSGGARPSRPIVRACRRRRRGRAAAANGRRIVRCASARSSAARRGRLCAAPQRALLRAMRADDAAISTG
jgi:hypothetical protein